MHAADVCFKDVLLAVPVVGVHTSDCVCLHASSAVW